MNRKTYLTMNTRYLTEDGLKYAYELTKDDILIYIDEAGDLCKTNNFTIDYKDFDITYDNFDSKYCRLTSSERECPMSFTDINEVSAEDRICKFYIQAYNKSEKWYKNIDYISVLSLSIVVSNYFKYGDSSDYLFRNIDISDKATFDVFSVYRSVLGIFFPYNKKLNSYVFKTNLFNDFDKIEHKLIKYIIYSKQISKKLIDIQAFRGVDYKCMHATRYSFACLLQIYFNLNGYETKIEPLDKKDKDGNLFNITIIKSSETTFAHRNRSTKKPGEQMNNITLDNEGYLIVSQQHEDSGITNVSLVKSYSYNDIETID